MDHRPKRNRQQPADEAAASAGRLLPQIIADIERRSEEQASDIADLRTLVETTVAEKEKIAARLGETEHELAEALAALEIERQKRQQAEAWTARLEQANRIARGARPLQGGARPEGRRPGGYGAAAGRRSGRQRGRPGAPLRRGPRGAEPDGRRCRLEPSGDGRLSLPARYRRTPGPAHVAAAGGRRSGGRRRGNEPLRHRESGLPG